MQSDLHNIRLLAERSTYTNAVIPKIQAPVSSRNCRYSMEMASNIQDLSAAEYRIDGLMPLTGLMVVFGAPGDGKSFVAIDAAMHVAAGRPYFGRKVRQGSVVYIAAEGGTGMRKRLKAWRNHHGIDDLPMGLITEAPNFGATEGSSADVDVLIDDIREQMPALGGPPAVIVIDTLARTLPGAEENSSSGMGNFINSASRLTKAFAGCLVIAVHHTGKDTARGMRGHSSLNGATDAEWRLSSDSSGEKTITLKKLKEGTDRLQWRFSLKQVHLAAGTSGSGEGVMISTCVVEPLNEPGSADQEVFKVKGNDALVLDTISELCKQLPSVDETNFDTDANVTRAAVQELAIEKGLGDASNPKSQKTMVNRCLLSLNTKGLIGLDGDLVWLI